MHDYVARSTAAAEPCLRVARTRWGLALVFAVVYTWRGETCRIISARRATSNESKAYYQALLGQAGA